MAGAAFVTGARCNALHLVLVSEHDSGAADYQLEWFSDRLKVADLNVKNSSFGKAATPEQFVGRTFAGIAGNHRRAALANVLAIPFESLDLILGVDAKLEVVLVAVRQADSDLRTIAGIVEAEPQVGMPRDKAPAAVFNIDGVLWPEIVWLRCWRWTH